MSIHWSSLLALLIAIGYIASIISLQRHAGRYHPRFFIIISMTLSLHTVQNIISLRGAINDVSVSRILTLIALCMVVLGLIRYIGNQDFIGYSVVASIASVCVWPVAIFPASDTAILSWGLKGHILFSIAAYTALGFGALYACFLLLQDYFLRRPEKLFQFSMPLNYIEKTMLTFTITGEILLSFSLITGLFFIRNIWAQNVADQVIFGAISWLIIAVLLCRHYHQGFRGRQAALWLLGGFTFLIIAYFGSAAVIGTF